MVKKPEKTKIDFSPKLPVSQLLSLQMCHYGAKHTIFGNNYVSEIIVLNLYDVLMIQETSKFKIQT